MDNNNTNSSVAQKIKSLLQYIRPRKVERFGSCETQSFKYFLTEIAVWLIVVCLFVFSTGLIRTATIGQEMGIMASTPDSSETTTVITEPPKQSDFEVIESEPTEATTQSVEYQTTQMCFIGDSRVVGMQAAVLTEVEFIAKSSMGLAWFVNTASVKFDEIKDDIELCIVALGINDINNIDKYIAILNEFADKYPDKTFIYANIGPVDEEKYTGIPNQKIVEFNSKMQQGLSNRWQIVDQYAYLDAEGFASHDGLHYSMKDSAKVFAWIIDSVKVQTITIVN
jgi:hypothetical protein